MSDQTSTDSTVSSENQTAEKLKARFADNESPTGSDFANLIEASFNKMDGPIYATDDEGIEIQVATHFTSQVSVAGQISSETDITVGDSSLTTDTLTVGDDLTLADGTLTLEADAQFEAKALFNASAEVSKNAESEMAALTVSGGLEADTLIVNESVIVGEDDAQLLIETQEGQDSIRVKNSEEVTQLALDDKGQLSLGLSGEQSSAKLHIRHHEGDSDTLLRVDNRANDTTPVTITSDGNLGVGTASPFNTLDVNGSVSVGQSTLVSPENSLSVYNRLGVGTASPMARLDIHTLSGETAAIVRDGDDKLLDLSRDGVKTDVDLSVKGLSSLADTQVNDTLTVKGTTTLENSATLKADADVQGTFTASADSQLQTMTAYGDVTLKKVLVVEGDAKHGGSIGVGLGIGDNHNPKAGLHIKESDQQPALKIENKLEEQQLLISNGSVTMGEAGKSPVDVSVHGDLSLDGTANVAQSLIVEGDTELNAGALVEKQLHLHQGAEVTDTTAFSITTEGTNDALHIQHVEEEGTHTLLLAKADKIGVHTSAPQAPLHVAGESRFDDPASFQAGVNVAGELSANANLMVTGDLSVNVPEEAKAQVHIAHDAQQISFRVDGLTDAMPALSVKDGKLGLGTDAPERRLDVKGDAKISGELSVNQVLTASNTQVTVSQQSTDPALTVGKVDEEGQVVIHHNKLGINVDEPKAALHVKGGTQLENDTSAQVLKVKETLTVTGDTHLAETDVVGTIKVNTPQESSNTDVHVRQSEQGNIALRVDKSEQGTPSLVVKSGQIGINTEAPSAALDVTGDAKITNALLVQGPLTTQGQGTFQDNAFFEKSAAFSVATPVARIHVAEQKPDTIAFQADYVQGEITTSLVARQGKLGIGTTSPKTPLDVRGDSTLNGELKVSGTVHLDNYLNVAQDAVFDSDVVIKEKAKLKDQAIVGRVDEIDPELMPNAQLYIADTHFKEALRIDSAEYPSLVFTDGKLGLGSSTPRTTLDVEGEARVSGKTTLKDALYVEGDIVTYNNIDGHGKLDVSQKATFGSDVLIRGDLYIEDKTDIEEELTVLGATALQNTLNVTGQTDLADALNVAGNSLFSGTVKVAGEAHLQAGLTVTGAIDTSGALSFSESLTSGVSTPRALQHFSVPTDKDALLFEKVSTNGIAQTLLSLDKNGSMALGKAIAEARLDVQGDGRISGALQANSLLSGSTITGADFVANSSFQLANSPKITGISADIKMGGDYSADSLIPTQAAVKAYIDNVVVPFGQGGKTYTISSQVDFDEVFNRGEGTIIDTNTTVLLLPLGNQDFNTTAYLLKNTVRIRSGVSIVGFNEASTRIAKSNANCRFEIIGTAQTPIEDITFEGFTFDGMSMPAARSGAAVYLEHAQYCRFNCRFENHMTYADGGALYGAMSGTDYTAKHIEARHIYYCQAVTQGGGTSVDRSEGGAAYGLERSTIQAYYCKAEYGGATSTCTACQVVAEGCSASLKGGAAYRCPQLRMNAIDCSVDDYSGQGGGAYFCSDLICEGQWLNNVAAQGPHIYASNNLTGAERESHYWKGDYVGRRIDDGTSVWRNSNE